jgi:hypothetical protein
MKSTLLAKPHLQGQALKKRLFRGMDRLLPMPQVVLKAQKLLIDPNSSFHNLSEYPKNRQLCILYGQKGSLLCKASLRPAGN